MNRLFFPLSQLDGILNVMEVGDGILPGSLGELVEKALPDDKLREARLR